MKVSSLKLIKQLVKKKVFFYPQKYLSKKIFFIGFFLIILLAFFSYFLKPLYFNFNENKDIIQNKINEKFKLTTTIDGNVSYSAKSYNNKYGVPLSLFNMNKNDDFGIFEVGMDKSGEIDFLSNIVKPDLAIITNISYALAKNFKKD